jgi:hypothetical protein
LRAKAKPERAEMLKAEPEGRSVLKATEGSVLS